MKNFKLSWQRSFAQTWLDRVAHNRIPHAVLLTGTAGVGKRAAARWIAAQRLDVATAGDLPSYPVEPLEHPDLYWISPPEDKQAIGIDQIRSLVEAFSMTSYEGGGKVAVIEPANAMTTNAANSLLKTLEEPSGDALLILVADRTGNLPATIFSRCQRIDIGTPAETEGLQWLDRLQPGAPWAEALRLAGNAPLLAVSALDQLPTHETMLQDFRSVARGNTSPLAAAARWAKFDVPFVLDWLARQVQHAIVLAASGRKAGPASAIDESVLGRIDRRNMFCYLDHINRLRGQPKGTYNVQLTLESLLIDWAEGLANSGQNADRGSIRLLAER